MNSSEYTPSGASEVPGVADAAKAVDPRAATAVPPVPPAPPATQALPAAVAMQRTKDLLAHVQAAKSIRESTVLLLQGFASMFVEMAPGNAAVGQFASQICDNAVDLADAITDSTPFAAPALTTAQRNMGAEKLPR